MINLLIAAAVIFGAFWLIRQFANASPQRAAQLTRQIGGVACILGAGFLTLRGQAAIAAPLFVFGLGLMGKSTLFPTGFPWERKSPGQTSRVRT
ncbi:MAG: molecular chaperone DnaJ, partial [Rhizobiales bacterium]|nr:molecular chaperone DnaJ [Hyphomicrobiales bacterium]